MEGSVRKRVTNAPLPSTSRNKRKKSTSLPERTRKNASELPTVRKRDSRFCKSSDDMRTMATEQPMEKHGFRNDVASINDLPDEVLLKVFSYLTQAELAWCSRVCLRWKKVSYDKSLWNNPMLDIDWEEEARHTYTTLEEFFSLRNPWVASQDYFLQARGFKKNTEEGSIWL